MRRILVKGRSISNVYNFWCKSAWYVTVPAASNKRPALTQSRRARSVATSRFERLPTLLSSSHTQTDLQICAWAVARAALWEWREGRDVCDGKWVSWPLRTWRDCVQAVWSRCAGGRDPGVVSGSLCRAWYARSLAVISPGWKARRVSYAGLIFDCSNIRQVGGGGVEEEGMGVGEKKK